MKLKNLFSDFYRRYFRKGLPSLTKLDDGIPHVVTSCSLKRMAPNEIARLTLCRVGRKGGEQEYRVDPRFQSSVYPEEGKPFKVEEQDCIILFHRWVRAPQLQKAYTLQISSPRGTVYYGHRLDE
jgi:hypothetical protein